MNVDLPATLVVTGAARGIGAEVVLTAARAGSRVAAVDVDDAGLAELVDSPGCRGLVHAVRVDVTDGASVESGFDQAAAALGSVGAVVNSAGGFQHVRGVTDITDEEWRKVVDLNLYGTFACCRAAFRLMAERGGAIVNVASEAGRTPSWPTGVHYVAAKAGVLGMTRHLALEGGPRGIRVNAVAPGTTMTERVASLYSSEQVAWLTGRTPLGRLAEVSDQVAPILFLLSDGAAYITGVTLDINGGRLML